MTDLEKVAPVQLLPEALRKDPCIQALSYALHRQTEKLLNQINQTAVYASVDIMPENILDLIAEEFRTQYYDTSMNIEKKRLSIKKALLWYEKAGTLKTVKELTWIVWGENAVSEWFEHGGSPFTFWLEVMGLDAVITDRGMEDFMAALQKVKNTRSLLDKIIFHRRADLVLFAGAAVNSYKRQTILDFYEEKRKGEVNTFTGVQGDSFVRQSIMQDSGG